MDFSEVQTFIERKADEDYNAFEMNREDFINRQSMLAYRDQSYWHQHENPDGSQGGWVDNDAKVATTAYIKS